MSGCGIVKGKQFFASWFKDRLEMPNMRLLAVRHPVEPRANSGFRLPEISRNLPHSISRHLSSVVGSQKLFSSTHDASLLPFFRKTHFRAPGLLAARRVWRGYQEPTFQSKAQLA